MKIQALRSVPTTYTLSLNSITISGKPEKRSRNLQPNIEAGSGVAWAFQGLDNVDLEAFKKNLTRVY